MHMGGGEKNHEVIRTVRTLSVLIVPIIALYAALVALGVFPNNYLIIDPAGAVGLVVLWTVISLYYFVKEVDNPVDHAVRFALHHIFALLTFVLVIGFWQPFAALYTLLLFGSYAYFGRKGLVLSILGLLLAGFCDTLLRFPNQVDILYYTLVPVFTILLLGVAIVGVVSSQETKRKALVHSRERERLQYDRINTIMNNLTDAAFSTNEAGKILMYNAACLDLLDTNDSLKGKHIGDLFNLKNSDNESINLYDVLKDATRATRRDDLNHSYSDGESIRLEVTFAPIRSSYNLSTKRDEQGGYILIMRDVTKQKSLEEERDEFISVVSHELRTPITIVEGTLSNLDLLMKQPELPNVKMLSDTVTTAHDQVIYLAKMVNDLSTLSRAERGVADAPEEIDVTELLQNLHHRYQKEAQARNLHLNIDLGARLGKVNVSRLYLEELLQNFITNAIKYTNEGSVTIIAKRSKGSVTFSVKDTGIGMSRTDQSKVFNKFYRSEDYRIRETNGTGLGLYVSTKLAHKLHTKVELTSRLNHGSTFSFALPVE